MSFVRAVLQPLPALLAALALLAVPMVVLGATAPACTFALGFKALHDQIPTIVGDCAGPERRDPRTGDNTQLTTRGLLSWRKKPNLAAFTDGTTTWLAGPGGLVHRPNDGPPFHWETPGGDRSGAETAAFIWPAHGPITTYFGEVGPTSPRGHDGIDIAAPSGSLVVAAAAGWVSAAGWEGGGYGFRVVVDHGDGLSTLYAHLSGLAVGPSAMVGRGQVLGSVGCTGYCTGPHLHLEIRREGVPRDPLSYLP